MTQYMDDQKKEQFWNEVAEKFAWPADFVEKNRLMEYPLPADAEVSGLYDESVVLYAKDNQLELDIAGRDDNWETCFSIFQGHTDDAFRDISFFANNMDELKSIFQYMDLAEKQHEGPTFFNDDDCLDLASNIDYRNSPPILRDTDFSSDSLTCTVRNFPAGTEEQLAGKATLNLKTMDFVYKPAHPTVSFDPATVKTVRFVHKQMLMLYGLTKGIKDEHELKQFVTKSMAKKTLDLDAYTQEKLNEIVVNLCCCSPFLSLPCPRHLPKTAPMFCRITA